MLESGKYLELINEKIAILRTEIAQSGLLGLTNLHKHSENFVRRLLNLTYNYNLINLNEYSTNFPGLDLGDENIGIAFQITSEKTSDKIEDTLKKVIRYKHNARFKKIKFLILSSKQASYTVNIETSSHFDFEWKRDIMDFADILKDIQQLQVERLKIICEFFESEFQPTLLNIKKGNDIKENDQVHLIDILKGLESTEFNYFEHFKCNISLEGDTFSVQRIYKALSIYCNQPACKYHLTIFNPVYQKKLNATEVLFKTNPSSSGAMNFQLEYALKISENRIQFEFAQYTSEKSLLTNLHQFNSVLILLFFIQNLYDPKNPDFNIDIDLSTSGNLIFHNANSLFHVNTGVSTYILNPSKHSFSKAMSDVTNQSLKVIMEEIIHGFVASQSNFLSNKPFLSIIDEPQFSLFDKFRQNLNAKII